MKNNNFNKEIRIFTVVLLCTLLVISSKGAMKVTAAVSTPKVSIVSLDHMPFLEGDSNQFFVAANNYTGKVQYQLFYTCETTMGNKWQLIKTSDMVNGWTPPSLAQQPVKVDISGLNLKADYYRFAIRVKRYGIKGTFNNSYGDYDYAYPFTLNVIKSSNVNLNGDIKINKNEFTEKQQIKIDGVKDSTNNVSYKLHLYDVKSDRWLNNLTEYGKTIDYNLNNLPEGPYIVDIWAKTDTSTNKYDGWKLSIINVKKETIPTVDLVSLDHQPFVEGDSNAFYVASKNYTGKVQYQFFYTCETTMGNKWELINTAEMKDGWTSAVDANEPLRVDLSSLNLKGENYRFAIRVKRVGFQGTYKNQYGDYDNAYPFNLTVEAKNSMKLNGEMLINKDSFAKNDVLKITGVKSASENTQYKLHLYDVKNNKWLNNLTEYGKTINYDLSNIPTGTYVLNIWAKDSTSSNKYDGWKLQVINITSDVLKVSSVENVQATAPRYGRYVMPKTVMTTLEDGSKILRPVIWDSEANAKKAGTYTIYGTVLGLDKKVNLTLTVEETYGNTNGNIGNLGLVAKNGDYIYYSESGDGDKLYRAKSTGEEITKISDDMAYFINIYKGYIYYSNAEDNSIYAANLDGSGRKRLTKTGFINIIVQDGWIYCTDDEELNIYKISLDGSVVKKLNNEASVNLNVTDDGIYYNNIDDSLKIYRITKDGTGRTKILNDTVGYLSVEDDTIYYLNLDDEAKIYKVKTDGTGKTKIYDETSGYLNLGDNGRLYFLNINANRMAYIDTLDKDKVYPMQNPGHFLNVIDEYVYSVYLDSLGMFRTKNQGPELLPFGTYYRSIDEVTLNAVKGAKVDLPLTVNALTINGDKRAVKVQWDTENVDTSTVAEKHIYTGSIIGSDVKAKATVSFVTIVSLRDTSYDLLVLANEKRSLPNSAMATLSNGEEHLVPINYEKDFVQESKAGVYYFQGTIGGYAEVFKVKVTVEAVTSVDFQSKDDRVLRYSKVDLPLTFTAFAASGRRTIFPIEWKYTSNIPGITITTTSSNKIITADDIGTYNFEGTVIGYNEKLSYTINVFENINVPTGNVIGKYDGYTLFYVHNKIYTINPEGTQKKLIAEDRDFWGIDNRDRVLYYKGWVYYRGVGNEADNAAGIYRMKLDGSERKLIRNVHIDDFRIANDLIYYMSVSTLYIAKLEESTLLAKIDIAYPGKLAIKDDYIYYSSSLGYRDVIKRAKIDGSNPTVFVENKLVEIVGDYIYYNEGSNLARMKLDGTNKLVYSNIPSYDMYSYRNIIIKEDYIYYAVKGSIYKINNDGTGNTLLVKTNTSSFAHFYLHEGFLYYDGDYTRDWIYRVKTDGTINEMVGKIS